VPDAADRVAAVPYDVVDTEEARSLARDNPISFLHVSRAEIDLPPGTDPHSDAVYGQARQNFEALKQHAPLVLEDVEALYVYRLRMGPHEQTGVAGGFALEDYASGVIRRHEHTRRDKEDDRTRHMLQIRAQTGPVFLTYRADATIKSIVQRVTSAAPLFDFTASDGVRHTVWRADARDSDQLVSGFTVIPALYIADGHHRAASAARARHHLRGTSDSAGPWDLFLAVAFADDEVQILPYNRIVRDLGAYTPSTFLTALQGRFRVSEGGGAPGQRGEVGMFLDGSWHTIRLPEPAPQSAPAERLDVSQLQASVLAPLLKIVDVRTDSRIDFVGGIRGTAGLEALVRDGRAAVAFALYPVSVAELMAVCDAGGIMPPKSTWFEPKLRDGLLSHVI
jgi:uncharacterized protein (DUF1015 family)